MECHSSDSKKLFKVFDASKSKRSRKRRDETNSVATDDSNNGCHPNLEIIATKVSLQNMTSAALDGHPDDDPVRPKTSCSPSMSRSSREERRDSRSPRRHRRPTREGISLALKAGMVSTPRSVTPPQKGDGTTDDIPHDQDSFIYAFLEEAIKRDKKKHRHVRRHESHRSSHDRERSGSRSREHRHRHRRSRDEGPSRERDRQKQSSSPGIEQSVLLETFAKLCAQITDKTTPHCSNNQQVQRTQSHKSLQCEVASRELYEDSHQKRLSPDRSHHIDFPYRVRSSENCQQQQQPQRRNETRDPDKWRTETREPDKCGCCYDQSRKYSKVHVTQSRVRNDDDRFREYPPDTVPTRTYIDYRKEAERYYDRRYDDDKRRRCEQTTSRSFDIQRESYDDRCRRTSRSEKLKHYEDPSKYYDKPELREPVFPNQERFLGKERRDSRRDRRNSDRFDRCSVVSRDDEFRDRFSEKERDSGLSVADGDASTISGRSNYMKVVKQEIAEQREAMDKMMKLWKELMRCFKGISNTNNNNKLNESAENVRESAAAQLRLWRECMRRYETVARDVGDTDARLMEEITKQRSEMAEMAGMWQECLQRYRDMSNDFNTLKQQLSTSESPTRMAAAAPLVCAEGEGAAPAAKYCIPPNYPPMVGAGYPGAGAALRGRASAPPAWWWGCERDSPRRRSSPDSRASSRRRHRHKEPTRDDSRYSKDKSKPSAARSEHRHRKR